MDININTDDPRVLEFHSMTMYHPLTNTHMHIQVISPTEYMSWISTPEHAHEYSVEFVQSHNILSFIRTYIGFGWEFVRINY